MAVVQYQNYCSPGFGLVARHPLQRLKRFLAKGAVPVLGEAWRAWAAGAAWLRGSAVPQHPESSLLCWGPAMLAVCPLRVSCGLVSIPPAAPLHTQNPWGKSLWAPFCSAGEHGIGGNCFNSPWEMRGLVVTPGLMLVPVLPLGGEPQMPPGLRHPARCRRSLFKFPL